MSLVRRFATSLLAAVTLATGLIAVAPPAYAVDPPRVVFGLTTTNSLVRFDSDSPGSVGAPVPVTGLQAGESLLGIDFRPFGGALYGLGSTSRTYTINPTTGVATQVGAAPLVPAINGSAFGFDFNPAADRIRIVSDQDQNLRVNPATGLIAFVDTPLAYDAGDVGAGFDPKVVSSAYTNKVAGAATTTLYGIDFVQNTLVLQGSIGGTPTSPNSGVLFTVGSLGLDVTSLASMDIADGSGIAYAVLATPGQPSALYTVDLTTGTAVPVGGLGTLQLRGLAVAPAGQIKLSAAAYAVSEGVGTATITVQRANGSFGTASVDYATGSGSALSGVDFTTTSGTLTFAEGEVSKTFTVPVVDDNVVEGAEAFSVTLSNVSGASPAAPTAAVVTIIDNEGLIYGVNATNQLFSFTPSDPSSPTTPVAITGLGVSENVLGIDFRPATGQLYALGSANRIYTINPATAAATQVGSDGAFTLSGTVFGFDFNPVADRIRVVSDTEQNLRINPADGTLSMADLGLNYAAGDVNFGANPNVVAAGYTNSVPGAATTTLYDIDATADTLVVQSPPDNGVLSTVGPLGVNVNAAAFDITPAGNVGLAAIAEVGALTSKLFSIDLASGAAQSLGPIGVSGIVTSMAIAPAGLLAVSPAGVTVNENAGSATVAVTRAGGSTGTVTVDYTTTNGSALAGADYTTTSGTLTFVAGDTTESFTVPIVNDPVAEAPETVIVTLSNPTGGAVLAPSPTGVVIIQDDDATFYALDSEGKILTFTGGTLGVPTEVPVTGLQSGETLSGLDVRPATNALYALGSTGRLYTLNPATGAATMVGSGPLGTLPAGTAFGVDFNPVADRLRIVSDAEQNLRVDVTSNTVTVDGGLQFGAGDPSFGTAPDVVGAAYTNSVTGLATTTLFGIDAATDKLVIQNPPNAGTLISVGSLGVDTGPLTGLDIAAAGGTAFATLTPPGGSSSGLYTINLATGAATLVGTVGGGATITGLALAKPTTVFEIVPGTTTPVSGSTISVTVTAKLAAGGTDTSYTGTPALTSADLVFVPGTCSAAVSGVSTCTGVQFGDLGSKRLSAVDPLRGIGSSATVVVAPTGLTYSVSPPSAGSVGDLFLFEVRPTAGLPGASISGYSAARTLTVTGDAPAPEVGPLTCNSAACGFSVVFEFSGDKTVQVTDNSTPPRSTPAFGVHIRVPTFIEEFGVTRTLATAGESILVGGFLVDDETGDPIAGAPVRIYTKTFPAAAFVHWRTVTTDADGFFFTPARMVRNTAFQARFLGNSLLDGWDSDAVTVLVRTKVVITSPPSVVPFGSPIVLNGSTFPAKAGARAYLIWRRPDGVRTLATATIGADGRWRLARGPLPRGTYTLYVLVPAHSGNINGYSRVFTVTVV